jgi:hypothetical protein
MIDGFYLNFRGGGGVDHKDSGHEPSCLFYVEAERDKEGSSYMKFKFP